MSSGDDDQQLQAEPVDASQELADLLYVISHDFNTPIRHIDGFARLVKDKNKDVLDDGSHDLLDRVISSAGKLSGMLNGMLSLSRVVTKAGEFELVALGNLVNEIVGERQCHGAWDEQTSIHFSDLPKVMCDETQIRSVFNALFDNALRYKEPGKPNKITVSQVKTDSGITIEVSDRGIGIDPKFHERIFKPLVRAADPVIYPDGHGIGLALCKKIVERHHGEISVQSSVGEGSKFHIHFLQNPPQDI